MAYTIKVTSRARKDIRKIDRQLQGLLVEKMEDLRAEPRPPGCGQVKTMPGFLRVRQGDYRIIYRINDAEQEILITNILHRSEAY